MPLKSSSTSHSKSALANKDNTSNVGTNQLASAIVQNISFSSSVAGAIAHANTMQNMAQNILNMQVLVLSCFINNPCKLNNLINKQYNSSSHNQQLPSNIINVSVNNTSQILAAREAAIAAANSVNAQIFFQKTSSATSDSLAKTTAPGSKSSTDKSKASASGSSKQSEQANSKSEAD